MDSLNSNNLEVYKKLSEGNVLIRPTKVENGQD